MNQSKKATLSDETFDGFLASQSLLSECEDMAIKEIAADQINSAEMNITPPADPVAARA